MVETKAVTPEIRWRKGGRVPAGPGFWGPLVRGEAFRMDAARTLERNAREYGDLVYLRIPGRDLLQFNHPELVQEMLVRDARHHHRNIVMQRSKLVLGEGLLTSEEPLHMRQRRLALRIVGKTLFDLDVERDVRRISNAVDSFMGFLPLAFLPFPELILSLPVPAMGRIRRAKAELDGLIYGMIRERRAEPGDRGDLLSMLLAAVDDEAEAGVAEQDRRMSDEQVRDECLTAMLAGHETGANAMGFALWLLARHPEVQDALAGDCRRVLGGNAPSAADYGELKFAERVFAEAMRLYPPVWVTARTAGEAYEYRGIRVKKGTVLMAPQFAIHRDARFFPEPLRFDPERFTDEAKAGRLRMAYFPFGAGSRQCIGEGLAWMEGVLALAAIVQDWRLVPESEEEPELAPEVTLRPKGPVRVRVERRG